MQYILDIGLCDLISSLDLFSRLVLRLRADDPDAICQLGIKYGCSVSVGKRLLHTACTLSLDVVGVRYVDAPVT